MKRAAAIVGPTPAFVRWAIKMPCGLRDVDVDRLPEATFRQLRAIQELDLARRENRVFQDVVFHSSTCRGQELIGFLPAEILQASGGLNEIESTCSHCISNIHSDNGGWVGCFGIAKIESDGWVDEFEKVVVQFDGDDDQRKFAITQPRWYGLWMRPVWQAEHCELVERAMNSMQLTTDWKEFREALVRCVRHDLEFHVEYFPPGVSDGQTWRWKKSCDQCRFLLREGDLECPCCRRRVVAQSMKKRKVLGLRPYMKLKYVLGEEECNRLVEEYLDWRAVSKS